MLLSWPLLSPWMKSQLLWEFVPHWAEISALSPFSFLSVFFQLLKPSILPIPSARSLSYSSYSSVWAQQAVRLISAINCFTCLATSELLQEAGSVKHNISEDWWKASCNLHLTLQCCSAAKHSRDIPSFLESHFVRFYFTTACEWKEPLHTGSQGTSFLPSPSSKCLRQQDRTDRLVCQSLKSQVV